MSNDVKILKILKCDDDSLQETKLTLNSFYECINETDDFYYVYNDCGDVRPYMKYRFTLEMEVEVDDAYMNKYYSENSYNKEPKRNVILLTI